MSIGDNSILGDDRWGGLFGIRAEFIAIDDVKVLKPCCTFPFVPVIIVCLQSGLCPTPVSHNGVLPGVHLRILILFNGFESFSFKSILRILIYTVIFFKLKDFLKAHRT